jgi:hypothetical protein
MSSVSETGHYKNLANLDQMISKVLGYKTQFNPSKESIKETALQSKSAAARASLDAVATAMPAYTTAVAAREVAFALLSKLITRVFSSLKASDTSGRLDEAVKTIIRKIQGGRVSRKKSKEDADGASSGEEKVSISSSQMSYDNRLDNLDKLIKLLSGITAYSPNEEDLKITSLMALYSDLKSKNEAVITAATPLSNARLARNKVLYEENTGLTDVAADVKSYIKSVFGARSPEFKQISGLKFTNPR